MPIKTDFLALDKIQVNEYYNCDVENDNLDKIDEKLKNHEERTVAIEDKVNKKDQLSVELSSVKKVNSITDSYGGTCEFEIKGDLKEQLNLNGNFNNGFNNIIMHGLTGAELASEVMLSSTLAVTNPYIRFVGVKENFSANDKYFVYCRVKPRLMGTSLIVVGLAVSDTHNSAGHFSNPATINAWNEMYDVVTVKGDRSGILEPYIQSYVTTLSNAEEVLAIDKNTGFIVIKLQGDDLELTKDELKSKYVDIGYFEGLQPLNGIALESCGKNLFNIYGKKESAAIKEEVYDNKLRIFNNRSYWIGTLYKFLLKPNTKYNISFKCSKGGDATNVYIPILDNQKRHLDAQSVSQKITEGEHYISYTFRTDEIGKIYIDFSRTGGEQGKNGWVDYWDIMLIEGSESTPYQSNVSTKVVSNELLAKLPNNICDRIISKNGKVIKIANTNVGRDKLFLTIKGSDISDELQTTASNINYAYTEAGFLKNIKLPTSLIDNSSYMSGRKEAVVDSHVWNSESLINIYSISPDGRIYFSFPKTITTTEKAKEQLDKENIKLVYQLDNTVVQELDIVEPLNSYTDYTKFNISDGVIVAEKANYSRPSNNTSYVINMINHPSYPLNSTLKFRTKKVIDIYEMIDGVKRSVLNYFVILKDQYAYGVERYYITTKNVEDNRINMDKIYVDYTTIESNGQSNATITYSSNIASAVSSSTNAINVIGDQVDKNTKQIDVLRNKISYKPTLLNSWVDFGIDTEVEVVTNGMITQLYGIIKLGDANVPIFTLPESFMRPLRSINFPVKSHGTTNGSVKVKENGDVIHIAGSNSYIDLSSIVFMNKGI